MMTKGTKYAWGNFVGVVRFPLWVRSEADSLEYVRRARATMDRKILSLEAFNFYGVIKFTMNFFGEKVKYEININYLTHISYSDYKEIYNR